MTFKSILLRLLDIKGAEVDGIAERNSGIATVATKRQNTFFIQPPPITQLALPSFERTRP